MNPTHQKYGKRNFPYFCVFCCLLEYEELEMLKRAILQLKESEYPFKYSRKDVCNVWDECKNLCLGRGQDGVSTSVIRVESFPSE